MKNIGGLNQFSAAANLILSQHFMEKKKKKRCKFTLFNKATKELNKTTGKHIYGLLSHLSDENLCIFELTTPFSVRYPSGKSSISVLLSDRCLNKRQAKL